MKRPRASTGMSGFSPRTLSFCTAHGLPSGSPKPKNRLPFWSPNHMISLTSTPLERSSARAASASGTQSCRSLIERFFALVTRAVEAIS